MKISANDNDVIANAKVRFGTKDLDTFRKEIIKQRDEAKEEFDIISQQLLDTSGEYDAENQSFALHTAEQGSDAMEREKLFLQAGGAAALVGEARGRRWPSRWRRATAAAFGIGERERERERRRNEGEEARREGRGRPYLLAQLPWAPWQVMDGGVRAGCGRADTAGEGRRGRWRWAGPRQVSR
jgi:hypothetical protein